MPLLASILDQLLGLTRVSWSDPRAALGWRWPVPAWGWALIVLGCISVAVWSYRRLLGPRVGRVALAAVRGLLLLFVAALLAGPMLVIPQDTVEPDSLFVLLDRSPSMTIPDMPASGGAGRISRDRAMRDALARYRDLFGPERLGKDRRVVFIGFSDNTYEVDPAALPDPGGRATLIRTAIEQVFQRGAGRPIAGIVLMTDGQTPQPTGVELVRHVQQHGTSVFTVPVGSESMALDLAVGQVDWPERAFINDLVPVTVWVDHYPPDAPVDASRIKVRLIDTQTGKVLDERSPEGSPASAGGGLRSPVHLAAESAVAGPAQWRVEVVYEGAGGTATQPGEAAASDDGVSGGELLTDNNHRDLALELVDRPIKVLYVEGYPRWEYRYLKNMLVRERSILSSIVLLSADRAFAQEGTLPITRLPHTAEELRPYDVVIIGDVPVDAFAPEELSLLRDQVGTLGSGLLWLGGEYDTPRSYATTNLAGLLPMRNPAAVRRTDPSLGGMQVRPTPQAEALNVLRLRSGDPSADGGALRRWPERLSPIYWVQDLGDLKPGVEPLAFAYPSSPGTPPVNTAAGGIPGAGAGRETFPLIVRQHYGAGQILYVATDETWRWRYGRGELYFEQLWMEMIRLMARSRLQQSGGRAVLTVSNRRAEVDAPVVVELRINDELLNRRDLARIAVTVEKQPEGPGHRTTTAPGTPETQPSQAGLPGSAVERIELQRRATPGTGSGATPSSPGPSATPLGGVVYEAVWRPSTDGRLTLRVTEPALQDLDLSQTIQVIRPDDEMSHPAPDPARLEALAKETGGQVVRLNELGRLAELVPNRARRTANDLREPLWNSYLALILVLLLLTAEWIGRKVIRLV